MAIDNFPNLSTLTRHQLGYCIITADIANAKTTLKVKEVKPKIDPDLLLAARRYDPNRELQQEQIIFRIDNNNIGSVQNIVTFSGLPKQGKSRYAGGFIAAGLSGQDIFSMSVRLPPGKNKIALFDTEQGDHDFYRQMEFIRALCNTTKMPANFDAFNTREDFPAEQILMIERYLQLTKDCGILILDGILDLLLSFNDEKESKLLMQQLKKWTKIYNILLVDILHKRKDGTATLGHIGSAADRVSQSVLSIEKNKERKTYILRPEFLRSADDFTPIEIMYNRNLGEWQQTFFTPDEQEKVVRMKKPKPEEFDNSHHMACLARIFNSQPTQTYKMLVQNICEIYASGTNWAKTCVPYLMSEGLLFKLENGYTNKREAKLFIEK